jgi:hypothetical protein
MSKILCISHIFPPSIDGGSRVIYKLGQYFEKQGNQVLYLSPIALPPTILSNQNIKNQKLFQTK